MQRLYYTKVSVGVILITSEPTERTEENMKLKAKTLGCLFSMISNYEPGEKVFLFKNGLNALKTILFSDAESAAVYRKALVLLLQLSRSETAYMVGLLWSEVTCRGSSCPAS